jgi:5-methylcytosine-specific restriction endonuclease McrA
VPVAAPVRPRDTARPLTADLSRYHLTVSRQFMETLARTRDALSHTHPGASTEELLVACMELMLEKKTKQKGLVKKPLATPRPSRSDHVPAHVLRAVMQRSGGRCEWVFENGQRCNSTHQVECDHVVPRALGGQSTVENTRAACRGHNQLAARRVFGDTLMDRYTGRRRSNSRPAHRAVAAAFGGRRERQGPAG